MNFNSSKELTLMANKIQILLLLLQLQESHFSFVSENYFVLFCIMN